MHSSDPGLAAYNLRQHCNVSFSLFALHRILLITPYCVLPCTFQNWPSVCLSCALAVLVAAERLTLKIMVDRMAPYR
jgi:hypothetical protein